jgi:hypothetical protein
MRPVLGCPQLTFAVEMGDVEAQNPCTAEAKRKAKWSLRGQSTEHKRGFGLPPQGAIRVRLKCLEEHGHLQA